MSMHQETIIKREHHILAISAPICRKRRIWVQQDVFLRPLPESKTWPAGNGGKAVRILAFAGKWALLGPSRGSSGDTHHNSWSGHGRSSSRSTSERRRWGDKHAFWPNLVLSKWPEVRGGDIFSTSQISAFRVKFIHSKINYQVDHEIQTFTLMSTWLS